MFELPDMHDEACAITMLWAVISLVSTARDLVFLARETAAVLGLVFDAAWLPSRLSHYAWTNFAIFTCFSTRLMCTSFHALRRCGSLSIFIEAYCTALLWFIFAANIAHENSYVYEDFVVALQLATATVTCALLNARTSYSKDPMRKIAQPSNACMDHRDVGFDSPADTDIIYDEDVE